MIAAIVGSREGLPWEHVKAAINEVLMRPGIAGIVSGGAYGVDSLGAMLAKERKITTKVIYPEWDKHGRRAGMIRNAEIVKLADEVFAFWDGKSKGTAHTIRIAGRMGKPCHVWTPENGWRS